MLLELNEEEMILLIQAVNQHVVTATAAEPAGRIGPQKGQTNTQSLLDRNLLV
jgi:hypothetical protein